MGPNNLLRHAAATLLLLTCFGVKSGVAQVAPPPPAGRYEEAVREGRAAVREMMQRDSVPGVGVAVMADGELVWAEGFGFADLEQRVPVTRETRFGIGSITKAMTMALYGRLVEEGVVEFDAPVESYLAEFPHKNMKISVRLIAGHLSGLDDSVNTAHGLTSTHYGTTAEALRLLMNEPLKYRPLERHFYTTGPYTFIAGVVERAARKDFQALMNQYVIGPLGLKDTVPNNRRAIVPHRTAFYVSEEGKAVNAPFADPSFKLAGAGYLSTAEDVARFGAAFLKPGFLKEATIAELFRPLRTSAGEDTGFALGWRVGKDGRNRRIIHQPGGGPGISCWLTLYPDEKLVVAILSNQTGAPVGGRTMDAIADSFVKQRTARRGGARLNQ
ncbi:MAG TPA: serine hydrolase domain-containing protein [Pyrinomonadaceae bacterium]|nr:serine hydrolase domain-containing protein [Pyrinomonadaceae bacterium]